ncbi:DoxX family protein [Kribbella sp. NBC_00482]|uniref:DoxX family protein n=1 Tax=Kribbella sp. NBC_00482 TaxID=2975968 RepID=UPI002E17CC09
MSTTVTTRRSVRPRTVALWVVQAVLAALFVMAAVPKLTGDPLMVDMFAEIGAGQWLRYVVGTLELAGAIGLLIPRLCRLAALGLAGLMVGASVTNLFLFGVSPAIPLAYLAVAAAVVWFRRPAR